MDLKKEIEAHLSRATYWLEESTLPNALDYARVNLDWVNAARAAASIINSGDPDKDLNDRAYTHMLNSVYAPPPPKPHHHLGHKQ